MSSGVKGGASRVSIPSGVKKTIENIKEITGQNHSEDEIYAMLKECSMDPNETAQKLLVLDTFHEVKRKRDRRKENPSKDPVEPKWKPSTQARANRVGRGNYSSRYVSHDASGGRTSAVKENATVHLTEKTTGKGPLANSQDMRKIETSSVGSQTTAVPNGPSRVTSQSTNVVHDNHASASRGGNQSNTNSCLDELEKPLLLSSAIDSIEKPHAPGEKDVHHHQILELPNNAASIHPAPASGSYLSSSDPVLLPSQDSPLPSAVGSIWREVGSQLAAPSELSDDKPAESKPVSAKISTSEIGITNSQQTMPKNQHVEPIQIAPAAGGVSTVSRPSSNYSNRSQVIGPQKAGPGKEWKPKSTNPNVGQGATAAPSEVSKVSQTAPVVFTSKEATPELQELQKKLEESHLSDSQHVIIPNHLHVPEVEKLGFCFGSFDAIFALEMSQNDLRGSEKCPSESESEAIEEPMKELELSNHNEVVAKEDAETNYHKHPQSPPREPDIFLSSEVEASTSVNPDYNESKMEVAPGSHQHPIVYPSSNYGFGCIPPVLSSQPTSLESSESQARDAPRLPGFVVPQSFDPTNYYAQFYRSSLDNDGRISPFHTAGTVNKYNGNAALVSAQTPQEGGVPLVLSTASPTPLVTQAAGVMQSSITGSQQPLPVFRHPTGVHLPHYPPNYIPYGPYFSPFYVPPPALHQLLSNGGFPQQPQAGGLYPSAPGTTAKYSVSQYKQGPNTGGSSAAVGLPGNYGPYGFSVANYTTSTTPTPVTSTSNEDIAAPHVKENNVFSSGQQNEGSGVWFTTPSRDISTLHASSFYNLPQGQVAFTPTQPGHGTFTGIFHPAQAVAAAAANVHPLLQQSQAITNPVDMVGSTASVYQQPQHAQVNWPTNY